MTVTTRTMAENVDLKEEKTKIRKYDIHLVTTLLIILVCVTFSKKVLEELVWLGSLKNPHTQRGVSLFYKCSLKFDLSLHPFVSLTGSSTYAA